MTKGYCKTCNKLVDIVARELKTTFKKERNWYPITHDFEGQLCKGSKVPI